MLRGINQQQIFEDSEDYQKFLQVLMDCKAISEFKLYAYCLMGNHIHLLVKEENEPIEQIFKRIGGRFVYWYNIKYNRVGHLFQDRFKSEPVDTDSYFLTVIRYIHQNPIKAGICKKIDAYEYSSYTDYIHKRDSIDFDLVLDMLPIDDFIEFNNQLESICCLDISEKLQTVRVTDEQARRLIQKLTKCNNVSEFQNLNSKLRDKYLKVLRKNGLSIRQISRLTGTSFNVVRKF